MSAVALLFGIISIALLVAGHFRLMRAWRKRPSPARTPQRFPSVSLIRPIRGLDVGAEENIRSLLALNYPGKLEILFVLDGADDPAYPELKKWIGQMPTRASRVEILLAGQPSARQTGKLNAMFKGMAEATGELVAFNDSDTRPSPSVLTQVVEALLDGPKVGSSFAPIYAQADAPLAGDTAYGLLVNAWYGSSVRLAAGPKGQMPFIMGQLMVLRREALESVGGLKCLEGQLIDDMYLGMRLASAGWENRVVVNAPLRVATGDLPLRDFFQVFRRWLLFSKTGLAFNFTRPNWERGIACWLAWIGFGVALTSAAPLPAAVCALALGFTVYSQNQLQRACGAPGLPVGYFWVPAVLPLLAAVAAGVSLGNRSVEWRGRNYTLDRTGALENAAG